MGDSDKLLNSNETSYKFEEHAVYLDAFFEECVPTDNKIVLVIHDWGSALGFWWAYRHSSRVKGIVFMEALVAPLVYDHFDPQTEQFFMGVRSPAGESMILQDNVFIEQILPSAILRNLTEGELDEYRRPFLEPGEARRPMLTWPREVPINGTPGNVVNIVQTYSNWMGENDLPKLFVNAASGLLLTGNPRELVRTWKNLKEVTVSGLHFIQEDSPEEIAEAIDDWLETLALPSASQDTSTSAALHQYPSSLLLVSILIIIRKVF